VHTALSDELLRADGVGYELIAPDCLDLGVTVEDATSLAECVMRQHECAVDQLYLAENRAPASCSASSGRPRAGLVSR